MNKHQPGKARRGRCSTGHVSNNRSDNLVCTTIAVSFTQYYKPFSLYPTSSFLNPKPCKYYLVIYRVKNIFEYYSIACLNPNHSFHYKNFL